MLDLFPSHNRIQLQLHSQHRLRIQAVSQEILDQALHLYPSSKIDHEKCRNDRYGWTQKKNKYKRRSRHQRELYVQSWSANEIRSWRLNRCTWHNETVITLNLRKFGCSDCIVSTFIKRQHNDQITFPGGGLPFQFYHMPKFYYYRYESLPTISAGVNFMCVTKGPKNMDCYINPIGHAIGRPSRAKQLCLRNKKWSSSSQRLRAYGGRKVYKPCAEIICKLLRF